MNQQQSLELFAEGREHWNAWAAEKLAEREALGPTISMARQDDWVACFERYEFEDNVDFSGFVFPGGAVFEKAIFPGIVGFTDTTFCGIAAFGGARFPMNAMFDRAKFSIDAWFGGAEFGVATFRGATFSHNANFDGAKFFKDVWFGEVPFSGYAEFDDAEFFGEAMFGGATFSGAAKFNRVCFKGAANFSAIESKSAFSVANATFLVVPDFIQAHFAEAPRLDDSRIEPRPSSSTFARHRDISARWRALRRLADQGHDHMHELEFFQNELKTRRWVIDRPWHAVFWFGLFYGWLSGFGRSIVRPLFWWVISALVFAPLYLSAHFNLIYPEERPSSAFGRAIEHFALQARGIAEAPPLNCEAGEGHPWRAALGLSARKALLIFGLDFSDKTKLNYACLYGVVTEETVPPGQLPKNFYLDVPNSVIVFGIAQHIISAVLLFLVLLAIRNHFRIK